MSKIEGVAKRYDGSPVDYVSIFNWADGKCIAQVVPSSSGSWEYDYYTQLNIGITYVSDGCEPITHGAYQFDFSGDRYWVNVVLLLPLNNDATDKSELCSFTRFGSTSYASGRFSSALELLPPSGSSVNGLLESTVSNPALSLGSDDFTIEFFVKPYATYTQRYQALISLFETHIYPGWQILLDSLKPSFYHYDNGGSTLFTSTAALTADNWSHIAVCRSSGMTSMYINGVFDRSSADASNYDSTNIKLSIGYQAYGGSRYPFTGMIDELRITKGVARYNSAFTPPSNPFPNNG